MNSISTDLPCIDFKSMAGCFSLIVGLYTMQVVIRGTGPQSAEMVTDEGAIYVTSNKGYNWKAAVEETVSATLNR